MVVSMAWQQNMMDLRESRPGLKEKYPRFPWEEEEEEHINPISTNDSYKTPKAATDVVRIMRYC
jgi:hypothetical protein